MINIIIALPRLEDARGIKNVLVRGGFTVTGTCTTGAQAISLADGLHGGIVICGYKLTDMVYSELHECLPSGFELLLIASGHLLGQCEEGGIMCLSMPLKTGELLSTVGMMEESIRRRRRRARLEPRARNAGEEEAIKKAKELLMARNHMSEEEAHRYLQKCSMDSGTNMAETALMVLAMT
ncbi:MAG: ANTAR domain-containing protein [Butyrivibrio sp.]|nr:ANTAR domain-containing protein [Acetatifactor muris]MCM1559715.1 ANTAR domain-containing protein [Butyrivibrio sp.]